MPFIETDAAANRIEQLQREKKLLEKEINILRTGFNDLLKLLDDAGICLYASNPDTKQLIYATESAKRLLDNPSATPDDPCYKALFGKESPCSECQWERVLTINNGVQQCERRIAEGTVVDTVAGAVAWMDGSVARVEIARPKQAAPNAGALVQGASFPCISATPSGEIIALNEPAFRLLGYEPGELTGRSILDLLSPESREKVSAHLASLRTQGRAENAEVQMHRKDGIEIRVRIDAAVFGYQNGMPTTLCLALTDLTGQIMMETLMKDSIRKLNETISGAVLTIAKLVEMKDPYTAGHQKRVSELSCAIARCMGLSEEQCERIRIAGILHDVGKVGVPIEILSKPGAISSEEFGMIKEHARIGHDILKEMRFPGAIAEIVLQHHERCDGSGYPYGLSGDQILLEARILAVADVVEAMSSHRPYRPALGLDRALEEIVKHKKTRYDQFVVDACLEVFLNDDNAFPELRTSSRTALQQHQALFGERGERTQ